jgi:hypothetical protein
MMPDPLAQRLFATAAPPAAREWERTERARLPARPFWWRKAHAGGSARADRSPKR